MGKKRSEVKQKQPPETHRSLRAQKKCRLEAHAGTRQDGKKYGWPHEEDPAVVSTKRATSLANQPRRKSIQTGSVDPVQSLRFEGRKDGVYVVKRRKASEPAPAGSGAAGGAGGPNKNRHYRR